MSIAVAGERVPPRAGDEHGSAVDAIQQECLQRVAGRCTVTKEYAPHSRAGAQLAGDAFAIDRHDRGLLR